MFPMCEGSLPVSWCPSTAAGVPKTASRPGCSATTWWASAASTPEPWFGTCARGGPSTAPSAAMAAPRSSCWSGCAPPPPWPASTWPSRSPPPRRTNGRRSAPLRLISAASRHRSVPTAWWPSTSVSSGRSSSAWPPTAARSRCCRPPPACSRCSSSTPRGSSSPMARAIRQPSAAASPWRRVCCSSQICRCSASAWVTRSWGWPWGAAPTSSAMGTAV